MSSSYFTRIPSMEVLQTMHCSNDMLSLESQLVVYICNTCPASAAPVLKRMAADTSEDEDEHLPPRA